MRLLKLIAVAGLTLITALALPAQTVRVIFTSGAASIQRPDEAAPRAIVKGESVIIGSRIVTGADGRVVLTPMPGVKSIVSPNTTLLLESVSENRTSPTEVTHQAVIDLKSGSIVSDLQKPEGVTYDYSIRTARGLAGARGTNYTVAINTAGIETILVSHGTITFNLLNGSKVSVTAGQIQITDASGVRTASKLGDLSEADQAFAQEVAESTLGALEAAVAGGVEINPDAISQALDLFESFGIDVSESTLQRIEKLREALEALKEESTNEESTVVTETTKETHTAGTLASFIASLNSAQASAFQELITNGGFNTTDSVFLARFANSQFTTALLETVNLYLGLNTLEKGQAVTLGILGNANTTAIGAKSAGLANLLSFYANLATSSSVLLMSEADYEADFSEFVTGSGHVFFPGSESTQGLILYNAIFNNTANTSENLYIGATRKLQFENTVSIGTEYTNFAVAPGNDLQLRSADLVSLRGLISKPVTFSADIHGIVMQSYTINLLNVNFPEGSVVALNSFNGTLYFNNTPVIGGTNFLGGVFYGEYLLDSQEAFDTYSRGNIALGAFFEPASLPTYTPTEEIAFYGKLTNTQRAIYDSLPDAVQTKLVSLNDNDITGTVLALDPVANVPYTATSIDSILNAYTALSTDARTFVKTLGGATGTGLANTEGTPEIESWSTLAIETAAAVFHGFDGTTQNTLVALGAGDAIIGINPDYLQGLLVAASDNIPALAEAGWGHYLQDIVNDSALSDIVVAAENATPAQRALIKQLDLQPYQLAEVLNVYEGNSLSIYNRLDYIINNVSSGDLTTLASIGFDSSYELFAYDDATTVTKLDTLVTNYNGLTTTQQEAARTLALGNLLSDASRAAAIADFYLGLPSPKQQALVDTDLVTSFYDFDTDILDTQANITSALNSYLGLSSRVRSYLLTEAEHFDLLNILTSTETTDNEGRSSRALYNIVYLIDSVATDPDRYSALLDMDIGRVLLFQGYLEGVVAENPDDDITDIKNVLLDGIDFYQNLTLAEQGTLRELGIIGSDHAGFLGTEYSGVQRLLTAYAGLSTDIRVDTQQIDETFADDRTYGGHVSYFMPFNKDYVMKNVGFVSNSNLYVGAVRRLRIDNTDVIEPRTTFDVPLEGGELQTYVIKLRAGDLIDLNGASYSANAAGIVMDAITINLANFNFHEGTVAALNSRDGGLHFTGTSVVGGVNFLGGVTYGYQPINSQPDFDTNARGNIAIGSHATPASLPTYTPPVIN
ncbi:MAG: FecR domain-containing protein [Rariglobus sp.]